jgi:general secretion pathway protein K
MKPRATPMQRARRGSALLLALVITALVATLAAAMVARQQRALALEAAERARVQSAWVLIGALDWARLILREDARNGGVDDLSEPWAVPLAEARLSTFLAVDREHRGDDEGPQAFLSGAIHDLQGRLNLRGLIADNGEPDPAQLATLRRLCLVLGVGEDVAVRLAAGLAAARRPDDAQAPLLPTRLSELRWLGVDETALARLAPYLTLLPQATAVNLNTASRELLAALIPDLDLGSAERIVQRRARQPYRSVQEFSTELGRELGELRPALAVGSSYFEVTGRLRLDERVFEERSVVARSGNRSVQTLWRERRSLQPGSLP